MIALLLSMALALDLDEARTQAMAQAVGVLAAEAEADALRGDLREGRERLLPSLSGFAQANTGAGLTPFGFERPVRTLYAVGVEGRWSVINPSAWVRITQARRTATSAEALLDWARLQARRDATVAYARAWSSVGEVDALKTAVEDATSLRDAIADLVNSGLRPTADLARAEAEAAAARARVADATGRASAACAELQGLIGAEVSGRCDLSEPAITAPASSSAAHPAMRAFQLSADASRAAHTAAGWSLAPTIDIDGQVAEYIVPDRAAGIGYQVIAGITVPILNGTGNYSALSAARARQRQAEAQLEEQRRRIAIDTISAEARLNAARLSLDAAEQGARAAAEASDRAEALYRAGREALISVLDARRARDDARVAAALARADVIAAVAEVEAARGVF